MNQPQVVDDRVPNKRALAEQAVAEAARGHWDDAVRINKQLIAFYPNEAEAYNRLGKALTELGRFPEARDAYAQALTVDPGNSIAKRNLDRLTVLASRGAEAAPRAEKINPRLFVEEAGKTIVSSLQHTASTEVLARMNAGDLVQLRPKGRAVAVVNAAGDQVGEIEPKLAQRLSSFLGIGNQYVAAVKAIDGHDIRIFIRETVQHPSLVGRPTFPTRTDSGYRAYTRDLAGRFEEDDLDDDDDDADGDYTDRERHEEDADDEENATIVLDHDHGFDIEQEEE